MRNRRVIYGLSPEPLGASPALDSIKSPAAGCFDLDLIARLPIEGQAFWLQAMMGSR
jgi:hypothetical protein